MNSDITHRLAREMRRSNMMDLARSVGSISVMLEESDTNDEYVFDEEYKASLDSFTRNVDYMKSRLSKSMFVYLGLKNKNEAHRKRILSFKSLIDTLVYSVHSVDDENFKSNENQIITCMKNILEILDSDDYRESIMQEKKALLEFNSIRDSMNVISDTSHFVCGTCYDDVNGVCFSPCGHMTCSTCSFNFSRCPFCRSHIDKKIKLFQP